MSRIAFLLLGALLFASAQAAPTDFVDPADEGPANAAEVAHWDMLIRDATETTALTPFELTAQATTATAADPLLPDASAMSGGLRADWPASGGGWSGRNDTVRVFKWSELGFVGGIKVHKGYYVIGKQRSSSGDPFYQYRVWITRYNKKLERDMSFGTNGWIFQNAKNRSVSDAQIIGTKAYVLVDVQLGDVPITIVRCIDLTTPTGSTCYGLFGGIQTWGATAAGPRTAAYGQRLAYDSRYGLFVAARIINSARGEEVGIARIDLDTGGLVTEFRGDGYNIGLPEWANEPNAKVAVHALAITPSTYPGTNRLYVAGQISNVRAGAVQDDGFILGMSPVTGATSPVFSWKDHRYSYESDNILFEDDAITALAIQRNGNIVFAGWTATDDADKRPLIMGRLHPDGSWDDAFCAGHPNNAPTVWDNVCIVERTPGAKENHTPVAIAERQGHGDLVVASRYRNMGNGVTHAVRTLIRQYSASGNTRHAQIATDYPGDVGQGHWSRPFDMWVGNTGVWATGEELITIVGTRLWDANRYDATTTLLRDTDSIFADRFGGAYGD